MNIDQLLNELKSISEKLESENISFQESVVLYEKSAEISKQAIKMLNESKGKIVKIKQDIDSYIEENFK